MGIFSEDLTEKLIFLYNALEFTISGISPPKKFSKDELTQIKSKINEITFTTEQKTRLESKITELNNLPLFGIIKQYCIEKQIPISDKEWEVIHNTRTKRNDIIHGKKDIKVDIDEVEKLQTLIERLLLSRLNDE